MVTLLAVSVNAAVVELTTKLCCPLSAANTVSPEYCTVTVWLPAVSVPSTL
jgi:hypothetical protein